uniref:Uncharacterized protein n=1 Tax=Anguilla anguilla TaxID=7936 RepID=A0A0E9RHB8_ANGAN
MHYIALHYITITSQSSYPELTKVEKIFLTCRNTKSTGNIYYNLFFLLKILKCLNDCLHNK